MEPFNEYYKVFPIYRYHIIFAFVLVDKKEIVQKKKYSLNELHRISSFQKDEEFY